MAQPSMLHQDGVKLGRCNFQPFGSRAAQQLLQAMLLSAEEQRPEMSWHSDNTSRALLWFPACGAFKLGS